MLAARVVLRDHGAAEQDPRARRVQPPQVREDLGVAEAREGGVPARIGLLAVVEPQVRQRRQPLQDAPLGHAGGLHAAVQGVDLGGVEQGLGEVGLEERLAAGERHAAAGGRIVLPVPQHHREHFVGGGVAAHHLQGIGSADRGAGPAVRAPLPIHHRLGGGVGRQGRRGARPHAVSAGDALLAHVGELRLGTDALGIPAPEAAQRAAFEEDRGADTGPVVDREPLDVENATLGHGPGLTGAPPAR